MYLPNLDEFRDTALLSWNTTALSQSNCRNFSCSNISVGNNTICSDIWSKYHDWYLKVVIRKFHEPLAEWNLRQFLKYHDWYLCQIPRTNHAKVCLYYYPQKVCNFHIYVFQIKMKNHCYNPIKLQKFLIYYIRSFCNLIGLDQWYFTLIWDTYMWKLQTFCR